MAVKFKIESNTVSTKTKIFADDVEIKGVRKYTLIHEAGKVPILTLEFPVAGIEVTGKPVLLYLKEQQSFY